MFTCDRYKECVYLEEAPAPHVPTQRRLHTGHSAMMQITQESFDDTSLSNCMSRHHYLD
jgi:hypothetical protein